KRAMEFCGMVHDYGLDIDWVASSRVNTVSRELMSAMAKTGLRTLYFGVESGTQHVLDLMGKAARLQQAIDSFKIAHESGVQPMGAFIIGYPGESLDEMEETINFAIKLEPDYAQFSVLTPYPGTPVYDDLRSKGLLLTEDWDKYTVLEPVVNYEAFGYTNKDVRNKLKRAYYRFYFRPSYLKKHAHMVPVAIKTLFKAQIMPKLRTMFKPLWNSSNYDADYDKLESLAGNLPMEGDLRVN
ncbi:MAG: B12-binding domain-containing radical SAM protein, partial [Candidatus Bathyarchaeia archaeon]